MKIDKIDRLTNEKWINLYAASFENRGHVGRWVFASRREKPHAGLGMVDELVVHIGRLLLLQSYIKRRFSRSAADENLGVQGA